MINVLYIHGMGGGGDSRIPSILRYVFRSGRHAADVNIVCRTYDFDPELAHGQIDAWVRELRPRLVIGESLGALHALRISGVPRIFVSPALNTPYYFEILAWLSVIPGVTSLFDRIYRPKEGDRQRLHFTPRVLRKYIPHRKAALSSSSAAGCVHAFFGSHDHYRRSSVVSVKTWKKYFGDTFTIYVGTHFMEEEHVRTLLADKVAEMLNVSI